MGGVLQSRCVGRVYCADGTVHGTIWFSAPSFWMGGGLQSRCVGRVYSADGAVHGTIRTVHTTHAAALKTTTHPKTR